MAYKTQLDQQVITDIATIKADMSNIKETLACLPHVCTMVTQHEEQIKDLQRQSNSLAKLQWWLIGIMITALVGGMVEAVISGGLK